jgi:single-stranded DNA-binding protein
MNSATFFATITQKPELRYTSDQKPICSTYIEFTERTKDAAQATLKATQVLIDGSLRMNKMSTPEGNRTVPEVNISRIEAIGAVVTKVASVSEGQKTLDAEVQQMDDEDDFPFE